MRTFKLEIRADFADSEKYEIVLAQLREKARELLSVTLLLKDGRDPQIALEWGDMFSKEENLELIEPEARGE